MKISHLIFSLYVACALLLAGCAPANITLFPRYSDPLEEQVLQGTHQDKILVIPIQGFISSTPREGMLTTKPSLVQEVVAHLDMARRDPLIRAVILTVDTPGGTTVDSDILYHEIERFRLETGTPVVVSLMGMATSGGYYISLASDLITAHPATITGSVGTIFIRPKVHGLMEKLGLEAQVTRSGSLKDMGSPFRPELPAEQELIQQMVDDVNGFFLELVQQRRRLSAEHMADVASARIYTASQALEVGLIDEVLHFPRVLTRAAEISGASPDARVVVYRRSAYANDNVYNTMTNSAPGPALVDFGFVGHMASLKSGFYYLWAPQYE
ncbi:signal peptide peptidase SppA, 36K type [Desulfurispirillum indicum S5]|uniref:Signal peptide peptidase SppA, 36K type n=1 Tax=Desulfurispirillum indicum (strain ATCC BAA-1389 / DSM 22839 / S5) TaxID=653733 RepID=E6W778_DESIS|nr:signal peptide peptidase SppA [Desulfurispirillum indicum]ADU66245.1 signal peptide peptidase SppA, 36K type [Desulfurispirillum indicum S5]